MSRTINDIVKAYYESASERYDGGKTAYAGVVTSAGDTVVITPPAGQRVTVYWVYALTNPDAGSTLITVKLGATPIYVAYGIAHWEAFTGGVDEVVTVNLSVGSQVAVTIHYTVA